MPMSSSTKLRRTVVSRLALRALVVLPLRPLARRLRQLQHGRLQPQQSLGWRQEETTSCLPDRPADQLYNEGLTLLNKKDFRRRRKESSKKSTASTLIRSGAASRS
jgi:hypothetical protein